QRTALALKQAEDASLAERAGQDERTVHTLVSRAVRFHDKDTGAVARMRRGTIAALAEQLTVITDVRAHPELTLEVLHARELAQRGIADIGTMELADRVARHDYVRGEYPSARALQEQLLAASSSVLGEDHPVTIASKSHLACTLAAQGDLVAGRRLQEE